MPGWLFFAVGVSRLLLTNFCRNAYCRGVGRYVVDDDGVGPYAGVCADGDVAEYSGSCADIDMSFDDRHPGCVNGSDGDLLKDEAVGSDFCFGVDDDAVGVGDEQSSSDAGVQRDIGSGNCAPEAVLQDGNAFDSF